MPTIDDRLFMARRENRRCSVAGMGDAARTVIAAVIVAVPLWAGACALNQDWVPQAAAGTSNQLPAVEPARGPIVLAPSMTGAGTSNQPPAVEPARGPIALAPSMTGAPPAAPSPVPARPVAASRPVPAPALPAAAIEMPMPPPASAPTPEGAMHVALPMSSAADEIPTFAPVSCPPGAIAMWGEPDATGTPAAICRRLPPPR
jgi:hypothetical protein